MKIIRFVLLIAILNTSLLTAQKISINEERFVNVGGIEQWITINGEDKTKPIILFIHGGPGSTISQYKGSFYDDLKSEFILVNWDQRGAGRTYGRNAPTELSEEYFVKNPLTVAQMAEDGIELTKYLIDYLEQKKVVLMGTSWGSILGTEMALHSPELYHAYIGHAQFVNFAENISYAYKKVYKFAETEKDEQNINKLRSLGKPPYDNAKSYGQLLRVVKEYERKKSVTAPDNWFQLSPEYDNEKDSKDRYDGDDYSFINFVGHEKLKIKSMVSEIDFNEYGLQFDIPVYYIQGKEDILTSTAINKPYFDKIKAPKKKYFLVPDAAHGFNRSLVEKQYEILTKHLSFE